MRIINLKRMATNTGRETSTTVAPADLVANEGGGEITTTYKIESTGGTAGSNDGWEPAEPDYANLIVNRRYSDEEQVEIDSIDLGFELANSASSGDRMLMRRATHEINKAMSVANKALYATARELHLVKTELGHGMWEPFLDSGILKISKRAARELVAAWPTLKDYPELERLPIMSSLTTRTLAFIFSDKVQAMDGKSPAELRKAYLLEAKDNSELTTEAGAKAYFAGKKAGKKEAATSAKDTELNEQIKALRTEGTTTYEANEDIRKVKAKELRAARKIEKLKEEIALIEESMKQMQSSKASAAAAKAYLSK